VTVRDDEVRLTTFIPQKFCERRISRHEDFTMDFIAQAAHNDPDLGPRAPGFDMKFTGDMDKFSGSVGLGRSFPGDCAQRLAVRAFEERTLVTVGPGLHHHVAFTDGSQRRQYD
jgi:hypothetical protein